MPCFPLTSHSCGAGPGHLSVDLFREPHATVPTVVVHDVLSTEGSHLFPYSLVLDELDQRHGGSGRVFARDDEPALAVHDYLRETARVAYNDRKAASRGFQDGYAEALAVQPAERGEHVHRRESCWHFGMRHG